MGTPETMNLWELARGQLSLFPPPTHLGDESCLRGRKKRRRKEGGRSLLLSFPAEINFSQGDKAIFIL